MGPCIRSISESRTDVVKADIETLVNAFRVGWIASVDSGCMAVETGRSVFTPSPLRMARSRTVCSLAASESKKIDASLNNSDVSRDETRDESRDEIRDESRDEPRWNGEERSPNDNEGELMSLASREFSDDRNLEAVLFMRSEINRNTIASQRIETTNDRKSVTKSPIQKAKDRMDKAVMSDSSV